MPTEPQREIEKLLRATAERRRREFGAPLELHPATRRMLQGEVARKFAAGQGNAPSLIGRALTLLRGRLAYVAASVAVLAVLAFIVSRPPANRSTTESEIAYSQKASPVDETAKPLRDMSPPPAPTAPPPASVAPPMPAAPRGGAFSTAADKKEADAAAKAQSAKVEPPKQKGIEAHPVSGPDAVAAPAPREITRTESSVAPATNTFAFADHLAVAASAPAPASATTSASYAISERAAAAPAPGMSEEQRARFMRRYGPAAPAAAPPPTASRQAVVVSRYSNQMVQPPAPASTQRNARPQSREALEGVLQDFQVEQAGQQLVLIDRDGSRYLGALLDAAPKRSEEPAKVPAPAVAPALERGSAGRAGADSRTAATEVLQRAPAQDIQKDELPAEQWFRAIGTNRTLQQRVEFTGQFINATPPLPGRPQSRSVGSAGAVSSEAVRQEARKEGVPALGGLQQSPPARIRGQARVGDAATGKVVQVDATAAPAR